MKPQDEAAPPSASDNLKRSDGPQVIRSHYLQKVQRSQFITQFQSTLKDIIPTLNQSPTKIALLNILPDFYLTYTTLVYNRRRLGQQYTYTTMFSEKDYQQIGTVVSYRRRYILSLMEIFGRHVIWKLIGYLLTLKRKNKRPGQRGQQSRADWVSKIQRTCKQILNFNLEDAPSIAKFQKMEQYFFLMLFMLKWSPFYNLTQTLLKIEHVYTFKNATENTVNYKIEGYMLLIIFLVKISKFCYGQYQKYQNQKIEQSMNKKLKKKVSIEMRLQGSNAVKKDSNQPVQLCRICYDQIQFKTATSCGHIFCWQCIIRTIETFQQCPVCKAVCLPRQCVQLQNF